MPRDRIYHIKEEMTGREDRIEYSNSQIAEVIDEYIHSDRDRGIMKSRLIDGWTYERIAEYYDMSDRHTKRIVYRCEEVIFRHLGSDR